MADDSHYTGGVAKDLPKYTEPTKGTGAVPMHHRLKLGHWNAGFKDPYGVGDVSKDPTISNGGRKSW